MQTPANPGNTDSESQFLNALQQCELNLETPFVPGELEQWTTDLCTSFETLWPLLQTRFQQIHAQEYKQIAEEDPGLFHRIEQLQNEDETLLREAEGLQVQLPLIQSLAEGIEPDEAQVTSQLQKFLEQALDFIIRVRSHEVSVRTWLMEATYRDRGTVD